MMHSRDAVDDRAPAIGIVFCVGLAIPVWIMIVRTLHAVLLLLWPPL